MTIAAALFLALQQAPPVDQVKIDQAIEKGVGYLKAHYGKWKPWTQENRSMRVDELVLWTLVHAGVSESDPAFQDLLKSMLESELRTTYLVSLQALILEEIERVHYQERIAQCAQFLVDNQSSDGQWSYGEPTPYLKEVPTGNGGEDVATSGGKDASGKREKPKVRRHITIKQKRRMPPGGDNSNSQYAILGLRACFDAGIVLPRDVVLKGKKWWESAQNKDGGWCYRGRGDRPSWGSMSAGAVGSLAIYRYLLGEKNPQADPSVRAGLRWLADHFSVVENPGEMKHADSGAWHYYYYLYALERSAILCGVDKMGSHWWYEEGAEVLLKRQNDDGSWVSTEKTGSEYHIWDTCFAILFLRRATRPLENVATGEPKRP